MCLLIFLETLKTILYLNKLAFRRKNIVHNSPEKTHNERKDSKFSFNYILFKL